MKTQEEQFIKVTGTIYDPFEKFQKQDPLSSLELFSDSDTNLSIVKDTNNQAFSKEIIQYSVRNYRSSPYSAFKKS